MGRGQKSYLDWESIGRSRKWLDYGLLCMYESAAMILIGADSFEFVGMTSILSWDGFSIYSPISGAAITVNSGSVSANEGDLIFIRNVDHPFKNETKSLSTGAPNDKATRKPTNLFLGVISGGSVYLFPSADRPEPVETAFLEQTYLPIADALDGASPPAALSTLSSGNGSLSVRQFQAGSTYDVVFPWEVPLDLSVGDDIRVQVLAAIPGTGMSSNTVVFGLKAYCLGDNDSINAAWGTERRLTPSGTYAQYDRLQTAFSGALIIPNLAQGELVMLHLDRQGGDIKDDFVYSIAVSGVRIQWTRKPTL